MAGVATEEGGGTRPSGEALADWRSLEQVENGTPSTSPPYWEIEDGEDGGQKPSELYGKYTWKIDKFSQINKRELRSNAFEVGGYKWYILIYPQGCDVCNHLSLFLCVANHDKLRPGWSHFAQFTISVVNKDPKKSKYSDTLHRFRKKEHDWGWKKFMELPKVMDGFIDADTLKIKAQVQVIRERAERPFRCLDCQYRRELVRVYLTNVEQLCVNFVGERRTELEKLMEDKARWTSFCAFWLGMDQSSRQRMSQERTESILKVMVKQFFVDKEVSSTLVMDSLYSGLKALQGQNTRNMSKGKYMDAEESPRSVILIEEDMFVLVDDVLLLIERAAMEPLPLKEEKGPQNRTKRVCQDGTAGEEFSKDSIERDEKRLTELGRRTIEIFVLSHIFSKIEVAYKEAVSLMRQEELIREEEAAWRGAAEKKFKKKQGKHKKANRKGKDKVEPNVPVDIKDLADESEIVVEKSEAMEDISDASDSVDFVPELLPLDSEDRDAVSPDNWDIDTPELHHPTETSSSGISVLSVPQIGTEGRSPPLVDDNSSTYSDESIPSVAINVPHTGNYRHYKNIKYPTRRTKHQSKVNNDNWVHEETSQPSEAVSGAGFSINASQSSDMVETVFHADVGSLKDRVNGTYRSGEKEEDARSTNRNLAAKDVDADASRERTLSATSPSWSPSKSTPCINHVKLESKANTTVTDPVILKKSLPDSPKQVETTQKFSTPKSTGNTIHVGTEKTSMPMATPIMSRPLSAPLFPAAPATRPSISVVHTTPALSRSVSASGRLGPTELSIPTTSSSFQSYLPQSYRNAIIGNTAPSNYYVVNNNASTSYTHNRPLYLRNSSDTMSSPGMVNHDALQSEPLWMNGSQSNHAPLLNDMQSLNLYNRNALADEFPHLDIINDLLDDEYVYGNTATSHSGYHNIGNGLNRQFSFQGDPVMASGLGPSCRFERTRSYHEDGFQHGYGGYDIPQASPRPYLTGQIDGLMPNQWQMPGSEMPFRGNMNDGYPYVTDYPNISVGANSFSFFRPSNGH